MTNRGGDDITVLHVDDDEAFVELAATFLEREDDRFSVVTATSVAAGMRRLTDDIDCIVSDYDMPDRNGIAFLELVRETYPELPFLLFTGKGSEEIASEAISAGVTDYLQKESGTSQYTVLANRIENAVDRYRTQQRLAAEKEQYQRLFEEAPVMYTVTRTRDGEPIIETCNQKFVDCLGYDRSEIVGESLATFYTDESTAEHLEGGYDRALSGAFITEERTFVTADGDEIETLLRAVPRVDEDGTTIGTLILSIDITDRKERERELTKTTEKLELALEAANFGVYDWNIRTDEISFTGQVAELIGFSNDEFERDPYFWIDRTHPDDRPAVDENMERLFRRETERCRSEYRIRTKDGDWNWIQSLSKVVEWDGDDPVRMIGVHQDISDRKEREQRLERKNERLDEFASVVSHDLRNPLNVAMGHLESVRSECECRGGHDHLDEIELAHEQMATLIDELLTLARQGDTIDTMDPIDLAALVERCWRTVDTGGATLAIETDRTITGDPTRVTQLLDNLLRNAVEHGGDDITITVGTLEPDGTPRSDSGQESGSTPGSDSGQESGSTPESEAEGHEYGFYVADDGAGVPAGQRERIFESGYSSTQDGTGLGLRIAREIATAHGWEIRLTESEDGGARFEITGVDTPS